MYTREVVRMLTWIRTPHPSGGKETMTLVGSATISLIAYKICVLRQYSLLFKVNIKPIIISSYINCSMGQRELHREGKIHPEQQLGQCKLALRT